MQEQWRDVKHVLIFKGYAVSNTGKVIIKSTGQELKQYSINGRPISVNIRLFRKGKYANVEVGKLVALAFIPNPKNYKYIAYKDGNKDNVNVNNIVWSKYPRFGKYWIPNKRKEIWKPIDLYPGYIVSNNGRVMNTNTNRILNLLEQKTSPTVIAIKDGKHHYLPIKKAMALAFIPNPDNKKHVNYKDNCRDNLFLENIEWADKSKRSFSMHTDNVLLMI